MLRAFDYGLLAALGTALAFGVLWYVGLTWGLIAVAVLGGWIIGGAIRHGVRREIANRQPESKPATAGELDKPAPAGWPRGTPILGALLGLLAWLIGTFIAFVIVQLTEGAGPLIERLSPENYAAFVDSMATLPVLHGLVLGLLLVVAAWAARAPRPMAGRGEG